MAAVPDAAGPDRRAPQYTCLDTHPWGRGGVRRCLLWIKAARRLLAHPTLCQRQTCGASLQLALWQDYVQPRSQRSRPHGGAIAFYVTPTRWSP